MRDKKTFSFSLGLIVPLRQKRGPPSPGHWAGVRNWESIVEICGIAVSVNYKA